MAGTIESLNFEVILQDEKFKKSVANDLKIAQDLNTKLTNILNLKKRLNSETTQQLVNAEKVRQAEQKTAEQIAKTALAQQKVATEVERTKILQERHTGAAKQTTAEYVNMKSVLRTLSQLTGVAFSAVGIRRFLESMIDITGQFEVQRMALRNVLQDVDGADKIFEDLYRFSSDSTYRFSELAKYAKQLSAFNIDKGSLLETTKMLGDVASGVGVSMDRLILAYGHVKSSGFLRGIQLRSFSQNGVPILDELAKMFSETEKRAVSLGEVFDKMTKREIPFEMVEEAFRRMTSEGGKFYQMQEVLAKTLAGQINILKGRWENMLAAVGQANSGPIKDVVTTVSNLIANYDQLGRKITELIVVYGAYRAAVFLMTAVSEGLFVATFNLRLAFEKLELALLKNPFALIAATVTATAYALYQFNTALSDSEKITQTAERGIQKYQASLASETAELDRLFAKLKYATEGTKEYDAAKLAIQNRFGPYLKQLQDEGVAVDNLAGTYDNLKKKITEAQMARFFESESDSVSKSYATATDNIYSSFKKTMEAHKVAIDEQEAIWHYITTGEYLGNDRNKLGLQVGTIGLPGSFTYKDFGRSALSLRKDFEAAATAYDAGMSMLEDVLEVHKRRIAQTGGETADELTYNIASIVEGIKKYDKDIQALRDKAKGGSITADEKQTLDNLVTARKEQTDLYKSIMGVDYDKDVRRATKAASDADKDAINGLKTKIALREKYLSIYQKIEPIKGDKTANWMADTLGGDASTYKDLEKQITDLTAELRGLGDAGKETADAIEARLGLDAASQLVKQFKADKKAAEDAEKALNKYLDALQKWTEKDKALEGTGVAYKVSKAIADYRTAVAEAERKYNEITSMQGNNRIGNLQALLNMGRDQNGALAKLKNNIVGVADEIFKEVLEKGGYDLTNWNDKTLGQIDAIKTALEDMDVPDDVKEMLKDYPELLDALKTALYQLAGMKLQNTVNPERMKKVASYAKEAAGFVGDFVSELLKIAETEGNRSMIEMAEGLSDVAGMASKAADAFSKMSDAWLRSGGGTDKASGIGAMFGSASSAGAAAGWLAVVVAANVKVLQLQAEMEAKQHQMALNMISMASVIRNQSNVKETMFGSSELDQINEVVERVNKVRASIDKYRDQIGSFQFTTRHFGFWEKFFGWMNNENWRNGELLPDYMENITSIEGVFDKYGNLNAEVLQAILDTYPDLTTEEREWITRAIQDSKDYAAAVEEVSDLLSGIYGDIASNAADTIIDSWVEAGDAALDYADILDDVARRYAKMLIQDAILKKVLTDERADEIADMFVRGDAEGAMAAIRSDMDKIAAMAPELAQILTVFDPYFKRAEEESSSSDANSLGHGIKGITEETASLLASYLNAIRADVSVMRALQEKGWENVAALAGVITPTLADYVQQIAANTYNASQDTAAILSELRSVIGPAGTTGDVLRVEMA